MSENEQRGLQRVDFENRLPVGFDALSPEEKQDVMRRLVEQDLEVRGEMMSKWGKSKIAEHDLAMGIDAVQRLDHERKIYSKHMKGETGSGIYELQIRGGDTKFIIPILIIIGAIVLGIAAIMALR
jgi:hypothetical protein